MNVNDWQQELAHSAYDKLVGIKIAKLAGDNSFSTYLTCIDSGKSVNPHYHKHGIEHYHIISGNGEITLIDIASGRQETTSVKQYNSFVVPENTLHHLKNTGSEDLILMFSCPESHLAEDRHLP